MDRRPIPPRLRWWLRWLLVALLTGFVLLHAYPHINEFLLIDTCLDSGGKWNDVALACQHG
jgi:hypothetical protein